MSKAYSKLKKPGISSLLIHEKPAAVATRWKLFLSKRDAFISLFSSEKNGLHQRHRLPLQQYGLEGNENLWYLCVGISIKHTSAAATGHWKKVVKRHRKWATHFLVLARKNQPSLFLLKIWKQDPNKKQHHRIVYACAFYNTDGDSEKENSRTAVIIQTYLLRFSLNTNIKTMRRCWKE